MQRKKVEMSEPLKKYQWKIPTTKNLKVKIFQNRKRSSHLESQIRTSNHTPRRGRERNGALRKLSLSGNL